MKDFAGKVAVVTGAGSGIGWGLAHAAAARGADVVVADIQREPLAQAAESIRATGANVLAVQTDVSRRQDVTALADAAIRRFGKVNLLFNNAGIFLSGMTWNISYEEYERVIGVNLGSVINGIKAFVPRMIEQGDECHVINTASGAGIIVNPGFASYSMTKHGVVALTEALWLDLATQRIANIGVTIVMPGAIQSKIMLQPTLELPISGSPASDAPVSADRPAVKPTASHVVAIDDRIREAVAVGLPAADLATQVFKAIEDGALYVLPNFDDEANHAIARSIALGRCEAVNPYIARMDALRAFAS